jgi:hypothetical protein
MEVEVTRSIVSSLQDRGRLTRRFVCGGEERSCRPLYAVTTSAPNSVQLGPKSDCHGASENLFTKQLATFQQRRGLPRARM